MTTRYAAQRLGVAIKPELCVFCAKRPRMSGFLICEPCWDDRASKVHPAQVELDEMYRGT